MTVVGSGIFTYEVQPNWFELPGEWILGVDPGRRLRLGGSGLYL